MRTYINVFFAVVVLLGICSIGAYAQLYSNGTGGGVWDVTTTWANLVVPSSTDSVVIVNGDVVDLGGSTSGNVKCLTVNTGGTLKSTVNTRSVTVYGGFIQCDGTIGLDTTTDAVLFQFRNAATTIIKGSGTANIYRIRATTTTGMNFIFDMNVNIGRGGGVYSNNIANTKFTINPTRTLILTNGDGASNAGGYIGGAGSKTTAGTANYSIDVKGTLVVRGNSAINLNVSGATDTLNVDGTIKMENGAINGYAVTTAAVVNIKSGGTFNVMGAAVDTTSAATINVASGGTIDLSNSSNRNLGTASISGKLRLPDATYPSGTITLNSGSTVEYMELLDLRCQLLRQRIRNF